MSKRRTSGSLSRGERIAGTVFLAVYLLVLPFVTKPLFRAASVLLDVTVSQRLATAIYYYVLFFVTVVVFHNFLLCTTQDLLDDLSGALKTLLVGLVGLYGLNELAYRLARALAGGRTNLNDVSISAQAGDAPRTTLLIVVFLAPFVEEVLFRGLVFGGLKSRGRVLAYTVSCVLFALMHVWQFAVSSWDLSYFLLMLQYLAPGLVLAWVYERSGTLWTSIALHAAANALAAWQIMS